MLLSVKKQTKNQHQTLNTTPNLKTRFGGFFCAQWPKPAQFHNLDKAFDTANQTLFD